MPDSSTDLLSYDELMGLFGDTIPAEAIDIVFNSPDGMLISEVRAKLNKLAQSRRSPSPAGVTEAAVEAARKAWMDPVTGSNMRVALLAAIPLLSPSMGWETIEHRVWDKRGFLIAAFDPADVFEDGSLNPQYVEWVNGPHHKVDDDREWWLNLDSGNYFLPKPAPTHWMPLPLPTLPPANGEGR